jgi:hypothetical protein
VVLWLAGALLYWLDFFCSLCIVVVVLHGEVVWMTGLVVGVLAGSFARGLMVLGFYVQVRSEGRREDSVVFFIVGGVLMIVCLTRVRAGEGISGKQLALWFCFRMGRFGREYKSRVSKLGSVVL